MNYEFPVLVFDPRNEIKLMFDPLLVTEDILNCTEMK